LQRERRAKLKVLSFCLLLVFMVVLVSSTFTLCWSVGRVACVPRSTFHIKSFFWTDSGNVFFWSYFMYVLFLCFCFTFEISLFVFV
jgi:hypothetical protein